MGFLKNIFGAIFGLVAGLLRLVGIGKKAEYFLEIDESQTASAQKPQEQPKPTEAKKPEPAMAAAKAISSASSNEASQNGSQAAPKPAASPQPVAAATTNSSNNSATFAPEYLNAASSQSGRRRPGASMGTFMAMAREVKTGR